MLVKRMNVNSLPKMITTTNIGVDGVSVNNVYNEEPEVPEKSKMRD